MGVWASCPTGSACSRRHWTSVLLVVLCCSCWQCSAAQLTETGKQVHGICRINVRGGSTPGSISSAELKCTVSTPGGRQVQLVLHEGLLGKHRAGFKGAAVTLTRDAECLVEVYSEGHTLFLNSSISGVDARADENLRAIFCATSSSHVTLRHSHVSNNRAALGVTAMQNATLVLDSSSVEGNIAEERGAGAHVQDAATLHMVAGSRIAHNIAFQKPGGGVHAEGSASVVLSGHSSVFNNTDVGANGGGVAMFDASSLVVEHGSSISNNTSSHADGGGVFVHGSASVLITGSSRVTGNLAEQASGGGLAAMDNATVVISGASVVAENTARNYSGGGLRIDGDASLVIKGGSRVVFNRAKNGSAGGLLARGRATVLVTEGSIVGYNTATKYPGGGIGCDDNASLVLADGSSVVGNTVVNGSGGGIAMFDASSLVVQEGSSVNNNTCSRSDGAGVYVRGSASVLITDKSRVVGNVAEGAGGGGLAALDNATVVISGASVVADNTALNASGGGAVIGDNALLLINQSVVADNTADGGGGVSCTNHSQVLIVNKSVIEGNRALAQYGGGVIAGDKACLNITDGVRFVNNQQWLMLSFVESYRQPWMYLSGKDVFVGDDATFHVDASIQADGAALTPCSSSVMRSAFNICGPGMYKDFITCQCCAASTYSFDANITRDMCRPCPAFATCLGADQVLPIAGYWHSTPRSVQMHQCPLAAACGDKGLCSPGFEGNLCASCAPGYGMTLPFRCGQCMTPGRQLGLYALLSFVTAAFITITVYLTWQDSCLGQNNLRASDLVKVLVQFFQYMFILGSITAPWPALLKGLFAATSVVFGAAAGQVLSPDCWLSAYVRVSSVPPAVQRQLISFISPLVLACVVVLLLLVVSVAASVCSCRRWCRAHRGTHRRIPVLIRQLPVVAIVVCFYSYPILVKAALSFFACVRIDDASRGPYAQYAVLSHPAGYWMYDMSQECFVGWHKTWALAFGLPAVLVLCVGVPVGLAVFMHTKRTAAAEPAFRERFGFLFRNYTSNKMYWEAVWAAQTVLLTTVAVFHYTIKAYYSVVLLAVMFLGSAELQLVARPCLAPKLNHMQLAASTCLFLTAYCTLALFTVEGYEVASQAVPVLISVLLIVLNTVFVLCCLFVIVWAATSTACKRGSVCRLVARCCRCIGCTGFPGCAACPGCLPQAVTGRQSPGSCLQPPSSVKSVLQAGMA